MGFLRAMDISASALTAERFRMDVISENIANAEVTRTAAGTPYKRRQVVFGERTGSIPFSEQLDKAKLQNQGNGVRVDEVVESDEPFKMVYDPTHPDANTEGYVSYPNVDTVTEMVDLISASRAYEANITAFNTTKGMALKALEIGK